MEVLSEQLARRSRLLPALGLLFVVVLWLVPSAALASVVTSASNGRSAEYHGDPGEANNVLVNETADTITFVELTNGIALTDSDGAGGCEVAGNVGTCPAGNLNNLVVLLGDGDDAVNAAGTTTFAIIQGGEGDDVLTAGDGNDSVSGQAGDDVLFGGAGNDFVGGFAGEDDVHGGNGDDNVQGHEDNDELFGDAGDDNLDDGTGNDTVHAGDGADEFFGDVGDDVFNGGPGDDYFNGFDFSGADTFVGGPGNDWLDYRRMRAITADLDGVADDGENCPGDDCEGDNAGADIENLSGGNGDDTLTGSDAANVISGELGIGHDHGAGRR